MYLTNSSELPPYLMFPRFLMEYPIPETAKFLYIVLLDRARLSIKNKGWSDESGHVFIFFPIAELAKALQKGETTIKNSLQILENNNLIIRKRQGMGRANQIFVQLPEDAFSETDRNPSIRQSENRPSEGQTSGYQTVRKLSTSKNNFNKNNTVKRKNKGKCFIYGNYDNVLLTDDELQDIKDTVPAWKDYIERLSGYMASTGKSYQNHAATIKSWARKDAPISQKRNYECKENESL